MVDQNSFKDPVLARGLIDSIQALAPEHATLMEVCGTHTVAIARNGIRSLMPEGCRLASGPGCPVCVTSNHDIDTVIALSRVPNVIITTFGDMTRVPGSTSSLLKEQAAGRDIRIVYSPLDALTVAKENPTRPVIFVGVGFETTTPLVAMAIKRAKAMGLANFSVYAAHKNMPGALDVLMGDPELKVNALILPGHVSTIIGMKPYQFLAEKYHIPGVITGFEPLDVLEGIAMIMRQKSRTRTRAASCPKATPWRLPRLTRCSIPAPRHGAALAPLREAATEFATSSLISMRCACMRSRLSPRLNRRVAAAAMSCAALWRQANARCSARFARQKTPWDPAW